MLAYVSVACAASLSSQSRIIFVEFVSARLEVVRFPIFAASAKREARCSPQPESQTTNDQRPTTAFLRSSLRVNWLRSAQYLYTALPRFARGSRRCAVF